MTLRPITLFGIIISMVTGISLGIIGYRSWLWERSEFVHALAFDAVLNQVYDNYVDQLDKNTLVTQALQGMLRNLDDHSLFLDASDYHDLQSETSGLFGGIGIELGLEDDHFTVITPLKGTPAERAGLLPGDRLIRLDQAPLHGKTLLQVVELLRGEPGTVLELEVRNATDEAPRIVEIERARIELVSVEARLLEPGYGYVRITQFQSGTSVAFADAIADLDRQSDTPLHGLVLDLRNNPGGVLQASVGVADALLTEGLIVYTEGRQPASRVRYHASPGDLLEGAPIVVLINGGSASAAEIVAGALQDNGRAQLMGSRSYGKGSVQSVVPVAHDQALKLTTAHYFTPNGRSIHRQGIQPDIETTAEPDAPEHAATVERELLQNALDHLKHLRSSGPLHALR